MQILRTGAWITQERIRVYSWMLIVLWCVGIGGLILTASPNLLDFSGRPIGSDFSNVWSAGELALSGNGAGAYDITAHHDVQKRVFQDPDVPYFGWHYPPFFLMIAAVLALMPYALALGVWMALSLPLYVSVIRAILPDDLARLSALAFPAVAINVIHGQNGFITAGLFGVALIQLDRRPVLSGIAFGLLAYKPHFGLLIPLVLALSGRWRTFSAATVTVLVLSAVVTALFGVQVWPAFFDSTTFTREVVLEGGALPWFKQQSIFGAVRLWGGGMVAAYAAQAVALVVAGAATLWLWKQPVRQDLKSAGLVCAALLVSPYVLDYDFVLLALAIAWTVRHGLQTSFLAWEKTALAFVWGAPLISRVAAEAVMLPIGVIAMVVLMVLIVAHARHDVRSTTVSRRRKS
ncbi:glycosyltransferase family 87 protein [Magnetovibrio sp. PR-2]|uniref:glycosyltransferase family 87 protein n=1 Tax=Magnetovibrio sp. PR-2 TaxID=3120356 RepID=UPI002FCE20C8